MRTTKCTKCENGKQEYRDEQLIGIVDCYACKGTGEISVYTIQELREGRVCLFNDSSLPKKEVAKVLNYADKRGGYLGENVYYWFNGSYWEVKMRNSSNLPIQSAEIFLEEIEQDEKDKSDKEIINHVFNKPIEQPEFKWGERLRSIIMDGKELLTVVLIQPILIDT